MVPVCQSQLTNSFRNQPQTLMPYVPAWPSRLLKLVVKSDLIPVTRLLESYVNPCAFSNSQIRTQAAPMSCAAITDAWKFSKTEFKFSPRERTSKGIDDILLIVHCAPALVGGGQPGAVVSVTPWLFQEKKRPSREFIDIE